MRAVVLLALAACGRQNFERVDYDADTRLPGLIAWYDMEDDPSDGRLEDSGGGGHVARCIAGVNCPMLVAGKHGDGALFTGSQIARVTYGAWLATPNAFTIAAWIYVDMDADQVAFSKPWSTAADDSWGITVWSSTSGMGTCLETMNAVPTNEWVCGPTLLIGRWFHVAGRWDGSAKALFIDGVKSGEKTNAPTSLIDNHDMMIGGDENYGSSAYQFHGRVDEVQVYDRALTDVEIGMLVQ